ncbi:MAG: EVE domain-containing protein [Leptospiraceae bacterium]|nr:EVE domain-containing protein [Leptospiraceae bacterium]MCP5513216.1 EVE domain-containing protein [Leptospiraceae bacterium]
MNFWLFKTEPDVFSIEDLLACTQKTSSWEGVRNYQARNYLRDSVRIKDRVLMYYSRNEPSGVIGEMEVVRSGYPDHFAFDESSEYFDPKSKKESPTWYMVDVKYLKTLDRMISLKEIKSNPKLKEMVLVKNSRLSIQPVTREEYKEIIRMAGAKTLDV